MGRAKRSMTLAQHQAAMRERFQRKPRRQRTAERRRDAAVLKVLKKFGVEAARTARAKLAEL